MRRVVASYRTYQLGDQNMGPQVSMDMRKDVRFDSTCVQEGKMLRGNGDLQRKKKISR